MGSGNETQGAMAFEVDAALVVEFGEKLVARKSVALAELNKNAYDADATDSGLTPNRPFACHERRKPLGGVDRGRVRERCATSMQGPRCVVCRKTK